MSKVDETIAKINAILKAEDDDLLDSLEDYDLADFLVDSVNDYEDKLAALLQDQQDHFLKAIESAVSKDDDVDDSGIIRNVIKKILPKAIADDVFASNVSILSLEFITLVLNRIAETLMVSIDKDIAFNQPTGYAVAWMESWSEELGQLMALSSHTSVEKILTKTLDEGKSMQFAIGALKKLPDFDRTRARRTAITEILTANSQAQAEAFRQSPAVAKKRWRHSGKKGITAREAHLKLDGTEVNKDDTFDVNGHDGLFPRDTALPPSERVECHCTMQPVIDEGILALPKKKKEAIREKVMEEFDYDKYKKPTS